MGRTAMFCGEMLPGSVEFASTLHSSGFEICCAEASSALLEALLKSDVPFRGGTVSSALASTADALAVLVAGLASASALTVDSSPSTSLSLDAAVAVGVHGMVRACSSQYKRVVVITDAADFDTVARSLSRSGGNSSSLLSVSQAKRRELATKAFLATSELDRNIALHLHRLQSEGSDKVLLLGSGGREHAIALKLAESNRVGHVYVAPGNGGTASAGPKVSNVLIGAENENDLLAFALQENVSLVVIGPEAPLVAGMRDAFSVAGIPCFGPTAAAAQLEASKAYSKDFMERHGIRTARYKVFKSADLEAAKDHVRSIDYPVVVKASGLAAGKGVILPETTEEAVQALTDIMGDKSFGSAGDLCVVEERLEGEEVSILAFCDGKTVVGMPGAQDHKRALDGDKGLNTGGMGAYAPAPCLTPALRRECMAMLQKTVTCMAQEGIPYEGILYGGFMLTKDGPSVLEYNCRFGDPETQVCLPLLESDLYVVFSNCVDGCLSESDVTWKKGAASTVVAAAKGYPESYPKGMVISGLDIAKTLPNVTVYHAGTKQENGVIKCTGGRVLAVTGVGANIKESLERAYNGMDKIKFDPMHFRKDIAWRALKRPLSIGVLGSTRGSSMQPIIDEIEAGRLNARIDLVVSNKSQAGILDRAKIHGLNSMFLSSLGKTREEYDMVVMEKLNDVGVDVVLLIGYMRIVSGVFCKEFQDRIFNVHPSLLPDFAGGMDLDVHEAVLKAKMAESGCTVHFVTEEVDGGPIAVQKKCPVDAIDTPETLKAKVQALEGIAFIETLTKFMGEEIGPRARKQITYKSAGVDIEAGDKLVELIKPACKSTRRPGCDADLGGFGGLFDLAASGYDAADTILVGGTDGVGTKLKIAQQTGNHSTIGVDLVAMCVNDLVVCGAEPLFFLDYYASGHLEVKDAASVVEGIAEGCRQANCGLIGGETAEMPSLYAPGDYDLAGFSVGAVRKCHLLPRKILPGDKLLGLPSSGVHSNGYSLVRKIVELSSSSYTDPCPFGNSSKTLGDELLIPTKIYIRALMPLIKEGVIKGLSHITGGGLLENLPRVYEKDVSAHVDITASGWKLPPVFEWLQKNGNIAKKEMLRTFNCGIGMVLIVSPEMEEKALTMLKTQGEEKVYRLGHMTARTGDLPPVVVEGSFSLQQ